MRRVSVRPIRPSGWAFPLSFLIHRLFPLMIGRLCALLILARVSAQFTGDLPEYTQRPTSDHSASSETARCIWTQGAHASGSAQGIAYSEFNHRVVGLFLLLIGLSELGHTVRFDSPVWTRLSFPVLSV